MTYKLGLTGSIGMGKSTATAMFAELGVPVWDADMAVHRLYARGGGAVQPVAAAFPDALMDGAIDRQALKQALAQDADRLSELERIVHPLVALDRKAFVEKHRDQPLVVFDIPLLFEGRIEAEMDGVAVVSTDAETQRQRVLARPGMTSEMLEMILSRQMSDAEKRARADWIIPSDTLQSAREAVTRIWQEITAHA